MSFSSSLEPSQASGANQIEPFVAGILFTFGQSLLPDCMSGKRGEQGLLRLCGRQLPLTKQSFDRLKHE